MKSIIYFAIVAAFAAAACGKSSDKSSAATTTSTSPADATHISIKVTEKGFEPEKVRVKKGVATTLIFTRTTDATCAKQIVIPVGDQKITKDLPLNQPVEVAVTFPNAGDVQYACGMDMVHGVLTVQ